MANRANTRFPQQHTHAISDICVASIIPAQVPHTTMAWQKAKPCSTQKKERQINQLHSNTEGPLKSKRLISLAGFSSASSPSFLSRFLTLQQERLTVRGSQRHSSRHTSDLSFNWLFHSPSPPLFCLAGQHRPLLGLTEETRAHTRSAPQ